LLTGHPIMLQSRTEFSTPLPNKALKNTLTSTPRMSLFAPKAT